MSKYLIFLIMPLLLIITINSLTQNALLSYSDADYAKYGDQCVSEMPYRMSGNELEAYIEKCINIKKGVLKIDRSKWGKRKMKKDPRGYPDIDPWNKNNPRDFDIEQACLGRKWSCTEYPRNNPDWAFHYPQCIEFVEKCVLFYKFDIVSSEKCHPGARMDYHASNKWEIPKLVVDDRKMGHVRVCMSPFAQELSVGTRCLNNKRCSAVCKRDLKRSPYPDSKSTSECVKKCEKQFIDNKIFRGHTLVERNCNRSFFRGNLKNGLGF